ncbi:MAG: MYXO-CTERM sorting domain-containing protein [Myxococcota bacterium]
MHVLLFAASLVPAEAGVRCLTPAHRADPPEALRAARRPAEAGYVDSERYPIRVHYRQAADEQRVIDVVLPAFETSWEIEVEQMGWPAPPPDDGVGGSDAYDVYFTNEDTYGGAWTWGFGPDVTPGDNWYSVPSYIAMDDRWIPDDQMLVFACHEFNHALQYTIDARERRVFPWESTAEAMTDLVDDASDLYMPELRDFQELPFASLVFDGYASEVEAYRRNSFYEYGGSIFGTFLEERYGNKDGTTLLAVWDALADPSGSDEPDYLDALGTLDGDAPSAAEVYLEFAVWRMFAGVDDDGAHFEEGALWPENARVPYEADLTLADVDGYVAEPVDAPYDLGTSYYRLDLGDGTDQALQVDVAGEAGAQWGLAWAVWPAGGGPATVGKVLVGDGEALSAEIPLAGGSWAQVGVVNAGPVGMELEGTIPRRTFTATFGLVGGTGGTSGTTDTTVPPYSDPTGTVPDGVVSADPDEKGGCGCSSGGSSVGWLGLLGVLAIRRRR